MENLNDSIGGINRCGALWRAARLTDTPLGPYDHNYIFLICHCPGLSQEGICRALCVNKSHVTRHLSRLEEQGYITRKPDEKDRRSLSVLPTKKALDVLPRLMELTAAWEKEILAGFSKEEMQLYKKLSAKALANAKAALPTCEEGEVCV